MFPAVSEHCRGALLHRFPYSVVFRSFEDVILIVAIAHAKRRTGYWNKRIMPKSPPSDLS